MKNQTNNISSGGSCTYFLGIIGSAVFWIGQAPSFWLGVTAFFKALVWPAFLVYDTLNFLVT